MVNVKINNQIIPISSIVSIKIEHEINEIPFINNKLCKFFLIYYLVDGRKIKYNLDMKLNIDSNLEEDKYTELIEKQKEKYIEDISNVIWNNKIITLKIEKIKK